MVIITSPLMRDKVKDIALNIEEIDVNFVKEDGINLYFKTNVEDKEAIDIIKKHIKNDPGLSGLIIKVREEY